MVIIGHRGASGLKLENTLESIKAAVNAKVDGIEIDIHQTKDGKLVLNHDSEIEMKNGQQRKISKYNLNDLKKLPLRNGEKIPTLEEAINVCDKLDLFIEMKMDCSDQLAKVMSKFPGQKYFVTSFNQEAIKHFKTLQPTIQTYLAEHTKPFEIIAHAKAVKADGITLNAGLMNPITYWLAKRSGLKILVYTVNNPLIGKFINTIYPGIMICTDFPNRFIK